MATAARSGEVALHRIPAVAFGYPGCGVHVRHRIYTDRDRRGRASAAVSIHTRHRYELSVGKGAARVGSRATALHAAAVYRELVARTARSGESDRAARTRDVVGRIAA